MPAEQVAGSVADEVEDYLRAGVPVGVHPAERRLVPLVRASGCRFLTHSPSRHFGTNLTVLRALARTNIAVCRESSPPNQRCTGYAEQGAAMPLHIDLPTHDQVSRLFATIGPTCVSVYLPTDPASTGQAERIALKNLVAEAVEQLTDAGTDKREIASLEEQLSDLIADDNFWRYQARSLAVFATPEWLVTYRLANRLTEIVDVADRFHLKPLLRSITFPQAALVLALSQHSVRLLEVLPEGGPSDVELRELPAGVTDAVPIVHVDDRSPRGKTQSSMAERSHLRIYCRAIDTAVRTAVAGRDVPLILAAAEPLQSIYRSVNTYPHLAETGIEGSPENTSDSQLADRARTILDEVYARELADLHELFDRRTAEGRTGTDVAEIARAATIGAVDTLFVDIDAVVPGFVDDAGAVEFAEVDDAAAYSVVDEIARRVWVNRGRVLAVRRDDIPGRGELAAILRY
ncbi:MAG TPA: hypothetical protein VF183_03995 [Acidimicrobiales bacterium]